MYKRQDSLYSHIAWLRKIQELSWKGMENVEVKFPLIEDIRMEVANKYGMIQPGQSNTCLLYTSRCV